MTTLDLAALRTTAEAATQGEWDIDAPIGDWSFPFVCFIVPNGETSSNMREIIAEVRGGEVDPMPNTLNSKLNRRAAFNSAHIAAFDPPTVLALIARADLLSAMTEAIQDHMNRPDYWDGLRKVLDAAALTAQDEQE